MSTVNRFLFLQLAPFHLSDRQTRGSCRGFLRRRPRRNSAAPPILPFFGLRLPHIRFVLRAGRFPFQPFISWIIQHRIDFPGNCRDTAVLTDFTTRTFLNHGVGWNALFTVHHVILSIKGFAPAVPDRTARPSKKTRRFGARCQFPPATPYL